MLIWTLNYKPFKRTSGSQNNISLGNKNDVKATISIRSHAIFLPFMTVIKHCFQSEILRTVNSTNSSNFAHLAKNYGVLLFKDKTSVYGQYHSPGLGEVVINIVTASYQFCSIFSNTNFVILPD